LRRAEFEKAVASAGIAADVACLDCPDLQAAWRISEHADRLADFFEQLNDATVFTHAYEGGHPDHDATAAAVHAALHLARKRPKVFEFAGYHAGAGMEFECFLGEEDSPETHWPYRPLTPAERDFKRAVLHQFGSQATVLSQYPLVYEPLRIAPAYDFSQPPHAGRLYYEHFDWGLDGDKWRNLAVKAFRERGVPPVC